MKEGISGLMLLGGAVILVNTLIVTVFETDLLAWLGRLRMRTGTNVEL